MYSICVYVCVCFSLCVCLSLPFSLSHYVFRQMGYIRNNPSLIIYCWDASIWALELTDIKEISLKLFWKVRHPGKGQRNISSGPQHKERSSIPLSRDNVHASLLNKRRLQDQLKKPLSGIEKVKKAAGGKGKASGKRSRKDVPFLRPSSPPSTDALSRKFSRVENKDQTGLQPMLTFWGSFSVIINNITLGRARPSPAQNSHSFSVAIYPGYASHAGPWCPILKRI